MKKISQTPTLKMSGRLVSWQWELNNIITVRYNSHFSYLPLCVSFCFSLSLSLCLFFSVCLCVCVPVCLSVCLPLSLSVFLSLCVCLSVSLCFCLSLSFPVPLSLCLSPPPLSLAPSLQISFTMIIIQCDAMIPFHIVFCICTQADTPTLENHRIHRPQFFCAKVTLAVAHFCTFCLSFGFSAFSSYVRYVCASCSLLSLTESGGWIWSIL